MTADIDVLVGQSSGLVDMPDQSGDGGAGRADLVHPLGHRSALICQRDRSTVHVRWTQRLVNFDKCAIR